MQGNKTYSDFLQTQYQKGVPPETKDKRRKRVLESTNWKGGSLENPKKYVVAKLPNGLEVYFLKPGKETKRETPNIHDMKPCVEDMQKDYGFDDIWAQLSKISVYDFEIFRAVLTLIYRNAYLLDHVEENNGHIRYKPDENIMECIQELENKTGDIMEYGLFGFLNFLDILGWNEDVKYNELSEKTGRLNTLLTCITIPYKTYKVVENIKKNCSNPQNIDWHLVYNTMTSLSRSGICPPRKKDLLDWFSPYIIE